MEKDELREGSNDEAKRVRIGETKKEEDDYQTK